MPKIQTAKKIKRNQLRQDQASVRWSINRASIEFGCDKGFLSRRLKRCGIIAADDGFYSTLEIATAVYGDVDKERSRKISNDADRSEMVNAQLRRQLVPKKSALQFICGVAAVIAARIRASGLDDSEKDAIIQDLQQCFNDRQVTKELYKGSSVLGQDDEETEEEEEIEE